MAQEGSQDRYAQDRTAARCVRAARILNLAAKEHPTRILAYALDRRRFGLAQVAANLGLSVRKLYPTMGRMIKLGMVKKLHVQHQVVAYELTYEGRLVATCLHELVSPGRKRPRCEEE